MSREIQNARSSPEVTDGRERAALYARYSSDHQRKASIENQFRNCREATAEKGWVVQENYVLSDEEKSGTTLFGRTGLERLVEASKIRPRPFEWIVIDDTSRLGRNVADVCKTFDILQHHGVDLYFANDGLNSKTPGFREVFTDRAFADQQFSKALGQKVSRGRRGRFKI